MSTGTLDKPKANGTTQPPAADDKPKVLTPFQRTKGWLQSDDFKNAIAAAMPKHMTPERYVRIAITAMMKVPKLAQCTQESVFNCLLQLAQYGLEPDGRNAHLIPFDVRKKQGQDWVVDHTDCTLIIDFKGYAELVMRSGLVSSIHADVVCQNDDFEYDRGFITKHKIDFKKPRGEAYAAYAVVRFRDGTEKCEVMPKEDILAIRDRSQGWKSFKQGYAKQSPWNPAEPVIEHEMWKKTCFRRITKWVPLSAEIRDAISKEDEEEVRLIDLRERNEALELAAGGSKSDQLAAIMQQSLEKQEAESVHQAEPDGNGEDSQDTNPAAGEEPQTAEPSEEQLLVNKLLADIPVASDGDRLDHIHAAIETVKDDDTRVKLHGLLKDRRKAIGAKKSDGKLPGT